ncbi:lipoprotein LpqH [Mycobacterium deserti]|uniref:Lipoprotein LpqH n=1 Tax=Mycobacterium deserti TaxID=2978347 RepID=A0ABT2M7W0_9MYCO|nr:lipoprotein LpqH [Mycobacterium deserti]MCT7657091.1 lipoprotein LpqH [Mycobacterium deserti]
MTVSRIRLLAGVFVTTAATMLSGCSDPEPAPAPPGSLSNGTAEVTIDGARVDTTHSVRCTSEGAVTTINTGDENAGTTSAVDTSEGMVLQFAQIRDLGGFTGGYWADIDPAAEVEVAGRTFHVNGTANGFNASNPSARITQTFSIRVAC